MNVKSPLAIMIKLTGPLLILVSSKKEASSAEKAARSSGDLPVKILLAKILSVLRLPALTGNKLWLRGGLRDRLPRRQIDRNAV